MRDDQKYVLAHLANFSCWAGNRRQSEQSGPVIGILCPCILNDLAIEQGFELVDHCNGLRKFPKGPGHPLADEEAISRQAKRIDVTTESPLGPVLNRGFP